MVGEMNKQVFEPSKSKLGDIDAKYAVLIAYLGMGILAIAFGWIAFLVPLIIYFIDKENKFIAFHAMQAFLLGITMLVVQIILAIIIAVATFSAVAGASVLNPYAFGVGFGAIMIIGVIGTIIGIIFLIFAIIALINGMKYEIYEIPLFGKWAEKIVFKTSN